MTEDWAEIRRLHKSEQMSIKAIVRRTGLARNTVRAALAADEPPRYQRPAAGSLVDGFEPAIRVLLAEFPSMPATVIAERVGWEHSSSVLRVAVSRSPNRAIAGESSVDEGSGDRWPFLFCSAVEVAEGAGGHRGECGGDDRGENDRQDQCVLAGPGTGGDGR